MSSRSGSAGKIPTLYSSPRSAPSSPGNNPSSESLSPPGSAPVLRKKPPGKEGKIIATYGTKKTSPFSPRRSIRFEEDPVLSEQQMRLDTFKAFYHSPEQKQLRSLKSQQWTQKMSGKEENDPGWLEIDQVCNKTTYKAFFQAYPGQEDAYYRVLESYLHSKRSSKDVQTLKLYQNFFYFLESQIKHLTDSPPLSRLSIALSPEEHTKAREKTKSEKPKSGRKQETDLSRSQGIKILPKEGGPQKKEGPHQRWSLLLEKTDKQGVMSKLRAPVKKSTSSLVLPEINLEGYPSPTSRPEACASPLLPDVTHAEVPLNSEKSTTARDKREELDALLNELDAVIASLLPPQERPPSSQEKNSDNI